MSLILYASTDLQSTERPGCFFPVRKKKKKFIETKKNDAFFLILISRIISISI